MDLHARVSVWRGEEAANGRIDRSHERLLAGAATEEVSDLRSFALDVVDISPGFASGLHAFSDIFARTLETALCHGLQFSQLTLLGIQLARSKFRALVISSPNGKSIASYFCRGVLARANGSAERGRNQALLTSVLAWQATCPFGSVQTPNSFAH